jgi:hypothetical protein
VRVLSYYSLIRVSHAYINAKKAPFWSAFLLKTENKYLYLKGGY